MASRQESTTQDQGNGAGAAAKFTIIEGRSKGRRYKIDQGATIGRSAEATIMLEDPEISRLHARVTRTPTGAFEVVDLNSRNGTYVNGKRVESQRLSYGDKVRVGPNTLLQFYGFDATEEQIIQRERFEAIGRLSIGIAHDLNNVLAALDAGTSYLRELPRTMTLEQHDVRECLADMNLASVRAAELTRAILSFVRGNSHTHAPVNLSGLVLEVARMLRHTLDRSIVIHPKVRPSVFVHGNRSELHQVLLNLCLNARDAMPSGGRLTLDVERLAEPPPHSHWPPEQPVAKVSVSDSGVGMDAATQTRIFEPFFTTKREGRGYGLGLATVREIATMHGGQITVESAIGAGTKFSLFLPALIEQPDELLQTAGDEPRETLLPPVAYSILLVDDEEIVRRSMARRMRQTGFKVTEADNGNEAIRQCQIHPVDLVLMDIDMPGLDGEQTFEQLHKLRLYPRVAFVSGYADPIQTARLKARGAVAILEKPCNLEALQALVHSLVEGSRDIDSVEDFESLTRPE